MKLARFLFKPRWQSKDVATRRGAVAELNDAELVAALPTIARNDADAGVRLAALRRLNHYEAWRERSTADADGTVRETARAAYVAMLTGSSAGLPPLERRIAELDTLSGEEIERVVTQGSDPALRSAALERATRPSLLADVAANDADPKLRLIALSRITDIDALARVAERTRKTDKVVSRLARDRAEAARIAAGDAGAIEQRARQLCERIDALLSRPRSERADELAALDEAWGVVAGKVPRQYAERFESTRAFLRSDTEEAAAERSALRALRARLDLALTASDTDTAALEALAREAGQAVAASRHELPERERVETALVQLTQRLAQRAVRAREAAETEATQVQETEARREATLEAIAAQARFDAALERAQADKEKQREQHQALRRDLDNLVIELEQRLEAGDLAHAVATHERIANLLEGLPALARHDKRLLNAEARLAELKRWQRWSSNERRKQLCEAMEALPALGLHPDAVATRVREARAEWQQLDAQDGDKDARGSLGLGRRFQALCSQALKPAQGYFAKRDELRKSNQDAIESLLAAAESEDVAAMEVAALSKQRRELADALRALDGIDPRARKTLAQRAKDRLTQIDTRLDEQAASVEAAKRKLIAEAERLATSADAAAAAREVRDLQARWKATGNGRRRTDESQWKTFRGHCDAVFAKLDSARRERDEADVAARAQAEALVTELAQVAVIDADAQPAQRRELEQRWSALDVRDRELQRRWQQQLDAIEAGRAQAQRRRRNATLDDALARLALCEAVELGQRDPASAGNDWTDVGTEASPLLAALQQRFDAAKAGARSDAGADEADDARRDLLVTLEFLAAIETPAEDKARRMDLQVARLSQRMSGGAARSARDEFASLLQRWIALGALPTTTVVAWQSRFRRAAEAVLAQLD
jgi:DNA repair protein SbcC/Rad50